MQEYILAAPEADGAGNPLLNIAVFAIFIMVTLFVVTRAGKTTSESADFYTGGSSFSGTQNGLALSLIHI